MKKVIYFIIASLFAIGSGFSDEDLWESKGPHVRIKKNDQDGSYVVFERSPDDRRLVKTTKNENGEVKMKATYTRDTKGFLRYGQIHDGQGVLIYRVQYGYDNESGQLVAEQMFDARVKHFFPTLDKNGQRKEMPIRRVYYFYDSEGNQSKAISLVPKAGKTARETFKKTNKPLDLYGEEEGFDPNNSTRPESPFDDENKKKAQ